MSPSRKLIITGLVLVQVLLLVGMVAVLRPVSFGGLNAPFWPGIFRIGGIEVREPIEEKTVSIGEGPEVIIRNDVGAIRVEAGQTGTVVISGERFARGFTREKARERIRDVVPRIRTADNRVEIEGLVSARNRQQNRIDLVVQVPEESSVTVDAKVGRVRVGGLDGNLSVDAVMGEVRVNGFSGNLTVNAAMGRIDVVNAVISERLRLNADMGSIEFAGTPGKNNRLDAGMGSVDVALPPDTALDLDVQVGMGSFRSDLPLDATQTERSYRGKLGRGEPIGRMEIDAGMGSVWIRARS
ncbi:MAG: hypothetical protein C4575_10255 [Desulforudis sp.]|jgi:hypothetical protein|nr:hypothetical protein [Clostridia bacterium]MDQ7790513.1 hypothetical protein [Clostridia bacterium]RJX18729.1 MAG: hypothetical protein C4575_10255 [Desulforudis sp.]